MPYIKFCVASNVTGTEEIIRLAAYKCIPLHHVSTSSVFVKKGVSPVKEDDPLETQFLQYMGGYKYVFLNWTSLIEFF